MTTPTPTPTPTPLHNGVYTGTLVTPQSPPKLGHRELVEVWRRANGVRWMVLLAPLLAILTASLTVVGTQPPLRATATFIATTSDWPGSPSTVRQAVEDFSALLDTDMFIDRVRRTTDVDERTLREGLSVSRIGASNVVTVVYTGPASQDVQHVAKSAAAAAHGLLHAAALGEARGEVRVLTERRGEAQARLDRHLRQAGVWLPEEAHGLRSQQVAELRSLLMHARLEDDADREQTLGPLLAEAEAELTDLADVVFRYRALSADVARVDTLLSSAEQRLTTLESLADRERGQSVINAGPVSEVSPLPRAVERGATTGIIVGAVAILLALVVGWSRSRRPTESPARAAGR